MKWIDCCIRMPEINNKVLIYRKDRKEYLVGVYLGNSQFHYADCCQGIQKTCVLAIGCRFLSRQTRQETTKMPSRIPKPCRKHGCPNTTTARYGYCEQHKNEGWVQHQRGRTRQQQGYGRAWEILRAKILKRDKYLCQTCLRQGIATEAKAVDHIKAKTFDGTDDETNLQAICHACHKAKTAQERFNYQPKKG